MNANMNIHIAIVGGGFAGLAAAYELANTGFAVTVLEARERLGGRVWSKRLPNSAVVELGGEWISSGDHTVLMMANRLNLPLIPVGIDFKIRNVVNGSSVSPADQAKTTQIAAAKLAAIDEKSLNHSTVGEFLDELPLNKSQRDLLRCRLQGSYGADLHDISLRMIGDYSLGPSRDYYRLGTGNQSLAEALAAGLPDVRIDHGVATISQDQDGVSIEGRAKSGAFRVSADAAIIAIPVKPLARLSFEPALPEAIAAAISSLPMGIAAKLAIGTRNPPPLRVFQDVQMPYWCWTGMGAGGVVRSAMTAFCGSAQAQQNLATNSNDPSIWLNKVQSANPDIDFLSDPIMVDWSQDEWAGGCYSAFDNEATDQIPHLSRPVGRIYFAGEHTDVESGTMEGALASGLHAARQIGEVF